MKNRVVVASMLLLVLCVSLGWTVSGSKGHGEPATDKHFLEVGKSYVFVLPPSGAKREEVTGRVVHAPRDNWVKVQSHEEALSYWINLNTVSIIVPLEVTE